MARQEGDLREQRIPQQKATEKQGGGFHPIQTMGKMVDAAWLKTYEWGGYKKDTSWSPVIYSEPRVGKETKKSRIQVSVPLYLGGPEGTKYPAVRYHSEGLRDYKPHMPVLLLNVQGANDGTRGNERIVLTTKGEAAVYLNRDVVRQTNGQHKLTEGEYIGINLGKPGRIRTSFPVGIPDGLILEKKDGKPKLRMVRQDDPELQAIYEKTLASLANQRTVTQRGLTMQDVGDRLSNDLAFYTGQKIHVDEDDFYDAIDLASQYAPELNNKWNQLKYNYELMEIASHRPELVMGLIQRMIALDPEDSDDQDKIEMIGKISYDLPNGEGDDAIPDLDKLYSRLDELGPVPVRSLVKQIADAQLSAVEILDFEKMLEQDHAVDMRYISHSFGVANVVRFMVEAINVSMVEGDRKVAELGRTAGQGSVRRLEASLLMKQYENRIVDESIEIMRERMAQPLPDVTPKVDAVLGLTRENEIFKLTGARPTPNSVKQFGDVYYGLADPKPKELPQGKDPNIPEGEVKPDDEDPYADR